MKRLTALITAVAIAAILLAGEPNDQPPPIKTTDAASLSHDQIDELDWSQHGGKPETPPEPLCVRTPGDERTVADIDHDVYRAVHLALFEAGISPPDCVRIARAAAGGGGGEDEPTCWLWFRSCLGLWYYATMTGGQDDDPYYPEWLECAGDWLLETLICPNEAYCLDLWFNNCWYGDDDSGTYWMKPVNPFGTNPLNNGQGQFNPTHNCYSWQAFHPDPDDIGGPFIWPEDNCDGCEDQDVGFWCGRIVLKGIIPYCAAPTTQCEPDSD